MYNGQGWLSSIHVILQTIALLCIEQQGSKPSHKVGWSPRELCANVSVNHTLKCWWDSHTHEGTVPTDPLLRENIWICGEYGWSISLRIGQAVVLEAAHTHQDRYYKPCHGPRIIGNYVVYYHGIIPGSRVVLPRGYLPSRSQHYRCRITN